MRSWNMRASAAVVAAGLALLFATPLRLFWLRDSVPWWSVFVLWAVAVAALFVLARVPHEDRDDAPPNQEPGP